jgi:hypothetical protein
LARARNHAGIDFRDLHFARQLIALADVLRGLTARHRVLVPVTGAQEKVRRARDEAATYFRDLWRLREARSASLMISSSLLPKAAMSIDAGSPLIESERSGSSGLCSLSGALFL